MRTTSLVLILLSFGTTAFAEAPAAACDTLQGWNDSCGVVPTLSVIQLATAKLDELGDCSQHSKKPDLAACAAEATTIGATLSAAALSMHAAIGANTAATGGGATAGQAKTGKAARSNANRMEAEETDE